MLRVSGRFELPGVDFGAIEFQKIIMVQFFPSRLYSSMYFVFCSGWQGHEMKLEHVGPTFSIFDGMPAKFTQKLLWLVLADKNFTGAIYVWLKAHSNDYSTIGQN